MACKPGNNANPKGRPVGAKDKRTELRDLFRPHAPKLVEKVVQMAKEGDAAAMRICIDRLIPPIKTTEEPVTLPKFEGTLTDAGETVLDAMAAGQVNTGQAAKVLNAIAQLTRIAEFDELKREMAEMRQLLEQRK